MNKKGQFESALLGIVLIFVVAIIFFFSLRVTDELYQGLDDYFNDSSDYNSSEARDSLQRVQRVNQSSGDWIVFAVFIGVIIQMALLSFATRINVAFYWIFAMISIVILIVGTILSNIWQEMASNAQFADTIGYFPITNTLLGSYYPTVIVGIILIFMIVLFGKPPSSEQ